MQKGRVILENERFGLTIERLCHRSASGDASVEARVREIIAAVRERGDAAVRELTERYDGRSPGDDGGYEIPKARWQAAADSLTPDIIRALERAAERIVINTPVQGSAADIIKVAMIRLDRALSGSPARIVLQVHDELVVEAPKERCEGVAALMKQEMEGAFELSVPLKVDVGIGRNWAEIH